MKVLLGALLLVGAVRADGQRATVAGHVHVVGDSTRAVADVEVALVPTLRAVRTDSAGAFRFVDVAPGSYTLRARRVGFDVATLDMTLGAGGAPDVRIAMRAGAQVLAEVTVSGHRLLFPARYAEAYERVAKGRGMYFTTEQIDSLKPYDVKSLLQRVPGVLVNDRGLTFQRCQAGMVSNLGSGFAGGGVGSGAAPNPAHVQVYLDGVRMTQYSNGSAVRDANAALVDLLPSRVQLVEVYSGTSRIPGEYLDDACAVILIWTKSY